MSAVPPILGADQVTVSGSSVNALPTLPDGSNPREILVSVVSDALGDAVLVRPALAGDAVGVGFIYPLPAGEIIRLKVAGFSHLRLDLPSGQANNPLVSIAAVA